MCIVALILKLVWWPQTTSSKDGQFGTQNNDIQEAKRLTHRLVIVRAAPKYHVCLKDDRLEKEEDARRAHEGWTRVKDNRRFRLPDEEAFRPGGTWKPPRSVRQNQILHGDTLPL